MLAAHCMHKRNIYGVEQACCGQVLERFGINEASQGICKRIGMAHLQQGRLGAALRWLGRCADAQALDPTGRELAARIAEHAGLAPSAAASGVGLSKTPASAHANNALTAAHLSCISVYFGGDATGCLRYNVIHAEQLLLNSSCWTAWGIAAAWLRDARCADELEGMLKDLQFLAAAGEADTGHQNGVLVLIRSYLCLLKAEQQVMPSVTSRSSTYWGLQYIGNIDVMLLHMQTAWSSCQD